MKKVLAISIALAALLSLPVQAQTKKTTPETKLRDKGDSLSYVIGLDVGKQMKKLNPDLKEGPFVRGLNDVMKGGKQLIDSVKADSMRQELFMKLQAQMEKEQQEAAQKNSVQADSFMSNNKKKEGVKVTASGLQYQILKEGTGAKPKVTDTVQIFYKGSLLNGTVFDSTTAAQPAVFGLQRIIPGLSEGLQLMSPGSKVRFWIPSNLGYGVQGAPPQIPPSATLIFDIELVKIGTKK